MTQSIVRHLTWEEFREKLVTDHGCMIEPYSTGESFVTLKITLPEVSSGEQQPTERDVALLFLVDHTASGLNRDENGKAIAMFHYSRFWGRQE